MFAFLRRPWSRLKRLVTYVGYRSDRSQVEQGRPAAARITSSDQGPNVVRDDDVATAIIAEGLDRFLHACGIPSHLAQRLAYAVVAALEHWLGSARHASPISGV